MMRTIEPLGTHVNSPPLLAVMFLAVLMAHLVYMSSPLHAWMLSEGSHADPMALGMAHATATIAHEGAAQDQYPGRCDIQWMMATQTTSLTDFLVDVLISVAPALDQHILWGCASARVLEPPSTGDAQALLQTFRE